MKISLSFRSAALLAALLLAAVPHAAAAADLPAGSPILDRIQQRGTLVVGSCFKFHTLLVGNPDTGEPVGFDADIVRALARKMLGDEKKIEWRWAQGKDNYGNIRFLVRGDVDIIADPIGESADKEAVGVAFTHDLMPAGNALLVRKGSPLRSVADLRDNVRVVCSDFFADVAMLKEVCRGHQPKILIYGDEWDAREALRSGKADVYVDHVTHLYDEAALSPGYQVVGQWTYAVYGMAVKSGDPVFLKYINDVIDEMTASGELQRLRKKWFGPYESVPMLP